MREMVMRRGKNWYEWRERDEPDSKFRTTKIPTYPICEAPHRCKWCIGFDGPQGRMIFPVRHLASGAFVHVVPPPEACHLVAMEFGKHNPHRTLRIGWLLTDEEKAAGKTGYEWPEDI